nr:J domain-containing protein [Halobellus ruber]
MTTLAFAYQPFLLLFALPFGIATYFLWYHASGRLTDRVRRTAGRNRANAAAERPGGFEGFGPGRRAAGSRSDRAGTGSRGGQRTDPNEPSLAEAYRTLGVDPGADEEAVRAAYRERAKATHPDADSGDEEEFKRVTRAYKRLVDD